MTVTLVIEATAPVTNFTDGYGVAFVGGVALSLMVIGCVLLLPEQPFLITFAAASTMAAA